MNNDIKNVKQMMQKGLFSVAFAKNQENRTEENATKMAAELNGAAGIACFTTKEKEKYWGVLVRADVKNNLTKENK